MFGLVIKGGMEKNGVDEKYVPLFGLWKNRNET